jgi:hypothetical protein
MPVQRSIPQPGAAWWPDRVTRMSWLPIKYRDFYDIPRAFVVEWKGDIYFFDCPFDAQADEYPDEYTVYRLRAETVQNLEDIPWGNPSGPGEVVGRVWTAAVELDPSKRALVSDQVFDLF